MYLARPLLLGGNGTGFRVRRKCEGEQRISVRHPPPCQRARPLFFIVLPPIPVLRVRALHGHPGERRLQAPDEAGVQGRGAWERRRGDDQTVDAGVEAGPGRVRTREIRGAPKRERERETDNRQRNRQRQNKRDSDSGCAPCDTCAHAAGVIFRG